MGKKQ